MMFPPDHCETAPFFVSVYLCFNLVYNVVLIVILKYGRWVRRGQNGRSGGGPNESLLQPSTRRA